MIILFFILYLLVIIYFIYRLHRIHKVGKFRLDILDLCAAYVNRNSEEKLKKDSNIFNNTIDHFLIKVTFKQMIDSFKPLKLESFYTEEAIKELKYG